MSDAVIVDDIRTPIGRAVKGTLRDIRADDLAAIPLRALVERNPGVDFQRDDWHKVLRANLSGSFYMSKPAITHMIDRGSGRIIFISSVTGEIGNIGQANYAASKSGSSDSRRRSPKEAAIALRMAGELETGIGLTSTPSPRA